MNATKIHLTLIPLKIYAWELLIKTINRHKNCYKLIKLNEKLLSIELKTPPLQVKTEHKSAGR